MLEIEINDDNVEKSIEKEIEYILQNCYEIENIDLNKIRIEIYLENEEKVRQLNKEFRNIDKTTDVLSFPMYEKNEIEEKISNNDFLVGDVLGSIIINLKKVNEQAIEYNHSFKREMAYLLVHGFYHLMGYDHIEEDDKKQMRAKEDYVLQKIKRTRGD